MEFKLDLGATVDVATKGEVSECFDEFKRDIFSQRRARPIYSHSVAAGLIGLDGTLSLDLGSPATGRIWNVTGYTIFGPDDSTIVANAKCALYFGDPDRVGIMGLVLPGVAIPASDAWGEKTFWCHSQENVVAVVSGTGTAGTQVGAKVYYMDWPESAVSGHSGK